MKSVQEPAGQEPTFYQPEKRAGLPSWLPTLIAVGVLGLAMLIAVRFFPATTVNVAHVKTMVVPTKTVFGSESIVVGRTQTESVLYVAETLRLDNELRVPIYLDNFTLTVTTAAGDVVETAVKTDDLATIRTSFPALEPTLAKPLLREARIDAGKQAEGVVLFALKMPKEAWAGRQAAAVKVDLYHQNPVYQTIPKE